MALGYVLYNNEGIAFAVVKHCDDAQELRGNITTAIEDLLGDDVKLYADTDFSQMNDTGRLGRGFEVEATDCYGAIAHHCFEIYTIPIY